LPYSFVEIKIHTFLKYILAEGKKSKSFYFPKDLFCSTSPNWEWFKGLIASQLGTTSTREKNGDNKLIQKGKRKPGRGVPPNRPWWDT
jgi:hypothetical protein